MTFLYKPTGISRRPWFIRTSRTVWTRWSARANGPCGAPRASWTPGTKLSCWICEYCPTLYFLFVCTMRKAWWIGQRSNILSDKVFVVLQDDMEGSSGGYSNGLPGREGQQVRDTEVCLILGQTKKFKSYLVEILYHSNCWIFLEVNKYFMSSVLSGFPWFSWTSGE